MVSFIAYDLIFLVLFTLAVVVFLYSRRKNLKRQGLLYLYRTRLGIKFIEWTSRKFPKTLYALQYVVVTSGYILMISMIYLLIRFSWIYLTSPIAARAIKVPVIIPLVPYLPSLFNLDFLPPLYFTFWIIIIAIIAVPHEFAHGIFARLNRIKIHSTGFGFLGPFLAAFVEPDEKQMEKAKKFPQLSILAAGTFANVIFTIIFGLIFWLFFISAFTPAGINFLNIYQTNSVNVTDINEINGFQITDIKQIPALLEKEIVDISISQDDKKYFANSAVLGATIDEGLPSIFLYEDTPAFNARLNGPPVPSDPRIAGAITEINGIKILSSSDLQREILKHNPNDKIDIKVIEKPLNARNSFSNLFIGEEKEVSLTLGDNEGKPYIGIFTVPPQTSERQSIMSKFYSIVTSIKDPSVYYYSSLGDFGLFIYFLLWWTVLISISVALVNMLPLGIFDGGRFFYLTMWAITGSKSFGAKAFKVSTWLILLLIVALMVKWVFIFI